LCGNAPESIHPCRNGADCAITFFQSTRLTGIKQSYPRGLEVDKIKDEDVKKLRCKILELTQNLGLSDGLK